MSPFEQPTGRENFPMNGGIEYNRRGEWMRRTRENPKNLAKYWHKNAYGNLQFDEGEYAAEQRVARSEERSKAFGLRWQKVDQRLSGTISDIEHRASQLPDGVAKKFYTDWLQRIKNQRDTSYEEIRSLREENGTNTLDFSGLNIPSLQNKKKVTVRTPDWESRHWQALIKREELVQKLQETLEDFENTRANQSLNTAGRAEKFRENTDRKLAEVENLKKALQEVGGNPDADIMKQYENAVKGALRSMANESEMLYFNPGPENGTNAVRIRFLINARDELSRDAMKRIPGDPEVHDQLSRAVTSKWQNVLHTQGRGADELEKAVQEKNNLPRDIKESYKQKVVGMLGGKTPDDLIKEAEGKDAKEMKQSVDRLYQACKFLERTDPDWRNKDSYYQDLLKEYKQLRQTYVHALYKKMGTLVETGDTLDEHIEQILGMQPAALLRNIRSRNVSAANLDLLMEKVRLAGRLAKNDPAGTEKPDSPFQTLKSIYMEMQTVKDERSKKAKTKKK